MPTGRCPPPRLPASHSTRYTPPSDHLNGISTMNVKHLKALIPALVLLSSLDARAEAPANKQLVLDFARLAFQEKQLHQAFQRYVAPDYIQHNPHAADGIEA